MVVGMEGLEPPISCSQSRRAGQAALHPGGLRGSDLAGREPVIHAVRLTPAGLATQEVGRLPETEPSVVWWR